MYFSFSQVPHEYGATDGAVLRRLLLGLLLGLLQCQDTTNISVLGLLTATSVLSLFVKLFLREADRFGECLLAFRRLLLLFEFQI